MNEQKYDLLISYSQIQVRAGDFNEQLCQWGKENIEQGAILHESYVVFDPLPDDTFGAQVIIKFNEQFVMDSNTQRGIVVPFVIPENENLVIASASELFDVHLNYVPGDYNLYYEICEGEESYYQFTFVKKYDSGKSSLLNRRSMGWSQREIANYRKSLMISNRGGKIFIREALIKCFPQEYFLKENIS